MGSEVEKNVVEIRTGEINASLTMQLATSYGAKPWICTVYFIILNGSFYWLSYPERRHSQDLARESRAAVAVVLQAQQPVVGVQAEGRATIVDNADEAQDVIALYSEKYNQGGQFMQHFIAGTNKHQLYRFTPERIMIFDERDGRGRSMPEAEAVII